MRLALILTFTVFICHAQDPWKDIYSSKSWVARDQWQRPDELIRLLGIEAGSQVADIGCHEGYMTFKLSRKVGATGKVYAVDVDESKLKKLNTNAEQQGLTNILTIKGDYDNPKLPANTLDAVIILDTYHEMDDHDDILMHVKVALKPGGKLILCEPIAEERRELPRAGQERKHELGMEYALDDLKNAGFQINYQKDPFLDRTKEKGDKMWVVVAVKP